VNVVNGVGRPRVGSIFGARAPASVGGASIAWRPDGRQIAYATARTAAGGYRLTLLSADGTVRPARRKATTMVWSPDAAHYAYITEPATWRDPRLLVIARATDGHRERSVRLAEGDTIDWYR
jgi:hypothetical protein